jgi:hypothetical protein
MSTANVVQFPPRDRPTPEQIAAQDSRSREERINQIREGLEKNRPLGEDHMIVAQAIYDLLVRIEKEHGIRKAKILGGSPPEKNRQQKPMGLRSS